MIDRLYSYSISLQRTAQSTHSLYTTAQVRTGPYLPGEGWGHAPMKMFKTENIEIVRECQAFFGFKLPSVLLNISSNKFIILYDASDNVVCTSLRVN